jgi:PAS domain-containing protein
MRRLTRVVIKDVEKDARFAPHRHVARAAGFRAVQSTPLVSREGRLLGMISTHFRQVHRPQWEEFESLDLYALHAADFLERCKREQMLRDRENKLRLALDAARAGTWSWNAKSQEASWDTRFNTLYDLPRNHPRSTETWLERVHPNDRPALIAEIKRVTSQVGDGNWDVEFRSTGMAESSGIMVEDTPFVMKRASWSASTASISTSPSARGLMMRCEIARLTCKNSSAQPPSA